jgi:primosomal replication protein N
LRYTPAGVPAVEFRLRHESVGQEAGTARRIEAEIAGIAFDAQARLLAEARLDAPLRLLGFLSAKSRKSKKLVLHVTNIEFIEESKDAPAAQR